MLPLAPELPEAENPVDALAARAAALAAWARAECVWPLLRRYAPVVTLDAADAQRMSLPVQRVEVRRDRIASRRRWQFGLRQEAVLRRHDRAFPGPRPAAARPAGGGTGTAAAADGGAAPGPARRTGWSGRCSPMTPIGGATSSGARPAPASSSPSPSARPLTRTVCFDLDWKPFAPSLSAGQRLGFSLRANPTVAVPAGAGQRGQAARRGDAGNRRAAVRSLSRAAACAAIAGGGGRRRGLVHPAGRTVGLHARSRTAGDRRGGLGHASRASGAPISFLAVDFNGLLTVRDPAMFLDRLAHGFGAAKAFGCGLMLIRPAPGLDAGP